jgi:hypothetical protein
MMDCDTLELKPGFQDTLRRLGAFWDGGMEDRPIVRIAVPNPDFDGPLRLDNYHTRIHAPLDGVVANILHNQRAELYLGEALPAPLLSFGCDEIAAFCGGDLFFTETDYGTNWSKPRVDDWAKEPPLAVVEDHPLWLRLQALQDAYAAAARGKTLCKPVDVHTNLGLLAALRGGEGLCMDLMDCPEQVDRMLEQTMGVFDRVYRRSFTAHGLPGVAVGVLWLQCDFSCLISAPQFRRFVLPYLEREAEYNQGRVLYHWDGVTALTHTDALIAAKGLYCLSFVPGTGNGEHTDFLDVYEKVQAGGKAVLVWGTPDQCKLMHRRLKPDMTVYDVHGVKTVAEGEALLEWFKKNT